MLPRPAGGTAGATVLTERNADRPSVMRADVNVWCKLVFAQARQQYFAGSSIEAAAASSLYTNFANFRGYARYAGCT